MKYLMLLLSILTPTISIAMKSEKTLPIKNRNFRAQNKRYITIINQLPKNPDFPNNRIRVAGITMPLYSEQQMQLCLPFNQTSITFYIHDAHRIFVHSVKISTYEKMHWRETLTIGATHDGMFFFQYSPLVKKSTQK